MTVRGWRIVQHKWAATAFSGEGARLYGGRWNSPGRPLVYTAEHPALAALEMLVHMQSEQLLASYVLIETTFGDDLIDAPAPDRFPKDWAADPAPLAAQEFGDAWLAGVDARPVLKVPSAVLPAGWNYLLNPRHLRFGEIAIGQPQPLKFDLRLK